MADLTSPPPRFPNGEYEIESIVGKGGMAIVYRARDTRHPRVVAIKVLRPEVAQSIGTTRFLREIAVAAPFSHPHILPLIDSGTLTDEHGRTTPYYVMPLVDGETLHQKLLREGRLPVPMVLRITREILEALQYAHAQGVIHRDIKPANILLSGGHAVVADFGVSRPIPQTAIDDPAEPGLTMTGDVIGTPSYMSPEQALGHHIVDARSDIFSVGCVMYEMLVGDRPFDTPIPQYTATKKRHGIFASARAARPEVSEALDAVLAKALKAEPEERYVSAAAFLLAIAKLEEKDTSGWGMLQQPVPRWMRNVAIGALAVIGVAVATWQTGRTSNGQDVTLIPPAIASDKSRVAVLPMESSATDSLSSVVANGFQTDLIDELAQYPALTVISKNGVLQFRGNNASTDSIARVLNVGSVVTGTIKHAGEMVWVTVRLIDGATGVVRRTATDSGSVRDLLAVRSSVIASATTFLRSYIGTAVNERAQQTARNSEAWELVARVSTMSSVEQGTVSKWTEAERLRRFAAVDSMLERAARLDPSWSTPMIKLGSILLQRAKFAEFAPLAPGAAPGTGPLMALAMRKRAIALATDVLSRSPGDASAFAVRGRARFEVWRSSKPVASESVRLEARNDLHRALAIRPDNATAWGDLSLLYHMSGAADSANIASQKALLADAFLVNAESVLNRRMFASLASGHTEDARSLCASGGRLYPNAPQFWGCELVILGWSSDRATDVAIAWSILQRSEATDTLHYLATGWATRRLLVAAIAARAGLPDSARAIVRTVRAAPESQVASDNTDYGEAYVHTLLGEPERALALLEKFVRNNPALLGQVRESPWFAKLKSNAKFIALTTGSR